MAGGAGSIKGGALETSNVNEAKEFVSLIQAQDYYEANARTIKIANEMLREPIPGVLLRPKSTDLLSPEQLILEA